MSDNQNNLTNNTKPSRSGYVIKTLSHSSQVLRTFHIDFLKLGEPQIICFFKSYFVVFVASENSGFEYKCAVDLCTSITQVDTYYFKKRNKRDYYFVTIDTNNNYAMFEWNYEPKKESTDLQIKFIYTGSLNLNFSQPRECILKMDTYNNFIMVYSHQGYLNITKISHKKDFIDYFTVYRMVDMIIEDLCFATIDSITYYLAMLLFKRKDHSYSIIFREINYDVVEKSFGEILKEIPFQNEMNRLIQMPKGVLVLGNVEIVYIDLETFSTCSVKFGHSFIIDYTFFTIYRMFMIDDDGFLFNLIMDHEGDDVQQLEWNKLGRVDSINTITMVSESRLYATTPNQKLLISISPNPDSQGNLFMTQLHHSGIGGVNDVTDFHLHASKQQMYNSVLISSGTYDSGELSILTRGAGVYNLFELDNMQYLTDAHVVLVNGMTIYIFKMYDSTKICSLDPYSNQLQEIEVFDFKHNNENLNLLIKHDNMIYLAFFESIVFTMRLQTKGYTSKFVFKEIQGYQLQLFSSVKFYEGYYCIQTSQDITLYKLNNTNVFYDLYTHEISKDQYVSCFYVVCNYLIVSYWMSNSVSVVNISTGDTTQIEMDAFSTKTIVSMACLQMDRCLNTSFFLVYTLSDGHVLYSEFVLRYKFIEMISTDSIMYSKGAMAIQYEDNVLVGGERACIISLNKRTIDYRFLNVKWLQYLHVYKKDKGDTICNLMYKLNGSLFISELKDHRSFYSRTEKVDYKPLFVKCIPEYDHVLVSGENLIRNINDFADWKKSCHLKIYDAGRFSEKTCVDFGNNNYITFVEYLTGTTRGCYYVAVGIINNYVHNEDDKLESELAILQVDVLQQVDTKIVIRKSYPGKIMSFCVLNQNLISFSVDSTIKICEWEQQLDRIRLDDPCISYQEGFSIILQIKKVNECIISVHDLLYGIRLLKYDLLSRRLEVLSTSELSISSYTSMSVSMYEHILCETQGKVGIYYKKPLPKSDTEMYKLFNVCNYNTGESIVKLVPIAFNKLNALNQYIGYSYLMFAESGWVGILLKIKDRDMANCLKDIQDCMYQYYYKNIKVNLRNSRYPGEVTKDKYIEDDSAQGSFILDGDIISKTEKLSDSELKELVMRHMKGAISIKDVKGMIKHLKYMY